ncbi:tetraspanin family protein [Streptomyces resistomycificus]|uniref:Uncharacterized protein n=1 Tax=Streptomyces resistomycificus TaxID=67356 RepID=A0A0L8L887_9ACTN|nr:tetraspanin family protein [Streptomyces resistomycificus]KOG34281.1 hypothetical protein ADK37_19540 [Streptomyces resistomycificus]KUO01789.1 hypothetical protein AQJ84_05035 [Streptomyces resistomycificus]
MPLAVEIVLIAIGIVLLALALIGSGISRRLMTIPKMHRAPRVVLAILGVLLLAGGMWGLSIESEEQGPSLGDLKSHIPAEVKSALNCTESAESPKDAVKVDCSTVDSVPEQAWYIMFPDVNAMQEYFMKQVAPGSLQGDECSTIDDYTEGSHQTYSFDDQSVVIGDYACYRSENIAVAMYTDRRFNIVVGAQISNPQYFTDFQTWVATTSQPAGDADATPTPSHTSQ